MRVIHILKDGSSVADIRGRVVAYNDAGAIYSLLQQINAGEKKVKNNTPSAKARA